MLGVVGRAVAGVVLAGAVLAACTSAPARPTARPATTAPTLPTPLVAPTTTTTAAPTRVRPAGVRPVAGFDDTTPPPALHATGTNYPAILRSIEAYRNWLRAHHPDAALEPQIYAPGTATFVAVAGDLRYLSTRGQRAIAIDDHNTYTTASVHGSLVTLRCHEVITEDRLLDRAGRVVRVIPYSGPLDFVMIMVRDASGRWRLADVTQVSLDPTVIL
jgi:hypothetical protein